MYKKYLFAASFALCAFGTGEVIRGVEKIRGEYAQLIGNMPNGWLRDEKEVSDYMRIVCPVNSDTSVYEYHAIVYLSPLMAWAVLQKENSDKKITFEDFEKQFRKTRDHILSETSNDTLMGGWLQDNIITIFTDLAKSNDTQKSRLKTNYEFLSEGNIRQVMLRLSGYVFDAETRQYAGQSGHEERLAEIRKRDARVEAGYADLKLYAYDDVALLPTQKVEAGCCTSSSTVTTTASKVDAAVTQHITAPVTTQQSTIAKTTTEPTAKTEQAPVIVPITPKETVGGCCGFGGKKPVHSHLQEHANKLHTFGHEMIPVSSPSSTAEHSNASASSSSSSSATSHTVTHVMS